MWEVSVFEVLKGYWYINILWKCNLLNKEFNRYGYGWYMYCRSWYDKFDVYKLNNDIFFKIENVKLYLK